MQTTVRMCQQNFVQKYTSLLKVRSHIEMYVLLTFASKSTHVTIGLPIPDIPTTDMSEEFTESRQIGTHSSAQLNVAVE